MVTANNNLDELTLNEFGFTLSELDNLENAERFPLRKAKTLTCVQRINLQLYLEANDRDRRRMKLLALGGP